MRCRQVTKSITTVNELQAQLVREEAAPATPQTNRRDRQPTSPVQWAAGLAMTLSPEDREKFHSFLVEQNIGRTVETIEVKEEEEEALETNEYEELTPEMMAARFAAGAGAGAGAGGGGTAGGAAAPTVGFTAAPEQATEAAGRNACAPFGRKTKLWDLNDRPRDPRQRGSSRRAASEDRSVHRSEGGATYGAAKSRSSKRSGASDSRRSRSPANEL